MTEQTQPTDAELRAWVQSLIADDDSVRTNDERDHMSFARAVLAKWGTPAGAGEPEGWITWFRTPNGSREPIYSHGPKKPSHGAELDALLRKYPLFTIPQPTQAQAGAVPLTDEQAKEAVRLLRGFLDCPFVLDEATCASLGLEETMRRNPMQVVVNMSCALLRIREARALISRVDSAHSIKGADHG